MSAKFRPISLLNCSYKIFTKVLTNRINRVADRIISSKQSAFIKRRYILESVVTAHEISHSVHQLGDQDVVLNLDYEKAYDKVNWEFLLEVLEKRGFGPKWMMWVKIILYNGSVGISVNNVEGKFFKKTGKGLRQKDPLSPILFNFVVDILSRMLDKAVHHGPIRGLGTSIVPQGVVCLQYADDTIIFLDKNPKRAKNLK